MNPSGEGLGGGNGWGDKWWGKEGGGHRCRSTSSRRLLLLATASPDVLQPLKPSCSLGSWGKILKEKKKSSFLVLQAAPIIRVFFPWSPGKPPGAAWTFSPDHVRASRVGRIMSGQERRLISAESLEGEPANYRN